MVEEKSMKVSRIHDALEDKVDGMLHNDLWQIIVNESCEGAFVDVLGEHNRIGVALETGGYIPMNFIITAEERSDVIDYLNAEVFGLLPEGAERIVIKSLRGSREDEIIFWHGYPNGAIKASSVVSTEKTVVGGLIATGRSGKKYNVHPRAFICRSAGNSLPVECAEGCYPIRWRIEDGG